MKPTTGSPPSKDTLVVLGIENERNDGDVGVRGLTAQFIRDGSGVRDEEAVALQQRVAGQQQTPNRHAAVRGFHGIRGWSRRTR